MPFSYSFREAISATYGRSVWSQCRHLTGRSLGPLFGGAALRLVGEGLVCARLDQPDLVGEDHRLDAVTQSELVEHVGDVGLDRGLADFEFASNLRVR